MKNFNTLEEAKKAGYVMPKTIPGFTELKNDLILIKNDTSGVGSFGYSFELVLRSKNDICEDIKTVATTTTVRLKNEKNKMNGFPSYVAMFNKSDFPKELNYSAY